MYQQHKNKQKSKLQPKVSPAVGKGKMAYDAPEDDDTTRLSPDDPVSPADSFQQFPTDLVSPATADPEVLLSKFHSIVRDEITAASRKLLPHQGGASTSCEGTSRSLLPNSFS